MASKEISSIINSEMEKILFIENNSENGMKIRANVCCCCDRLLKYDEVNYIDVKDLDISKDISLKWKQDDGEITTIVKKYVSSITRVHFQKVG